jgi:hypothetical protein
MLNMQVWELQAFLAIAAFAPMHPHQGALDDLPIVIVLARESLISIQIFGRVCVERGAIELCLAAPIFQ